MAKDVEDELKLNNWLSITTYDITKYVKAGGQVEVERTADGLAVRFILSDIDAMDINKHFRRMFAPALEASNA